MSDANNSCGSNLFLTLRNGSGIRLRASRSKSPKFPGALLPYTEGNRIMLTFIEDFVIIDIVQIKI